MTVVVHRRAMMCYRVVALLKTVRQFNDVFYILKNAV